MAGTLIPFDPISGKPGPLPGCDEYLPELGRDFRLVVTTGDETASARALLRRFDLLDHFETVVGDLFARMGKPYGDILRGLGGTPSRSLAIGDRLQADICGDCDDVVTLLVNQNGDTGNAGMVAWMVARLLKEDPEFPAAFDKLASTADPDGEVPRPTHGGEIVGSWKRQDGFPWHLLRFKHPALGGDRRIIVL